MVHRRKNYVCSLPMSHGKEGTRICIVGKQKVAEFCCSSHVTVNLKNQTVMPISLLHLPANPGVKNVKT